MSESGWSETIHRNKDRTIYLAENRFRIQASRYRGDFVWCVEMIFWGLGGKKRITVTTQTRAIRTKTAQRILLEEADLLSKTLYDYLYSEELNKEEVHA